MKYSITGSTGHISKPVIEKLIQQGHEVTVITSKNENIPAIEALGAKALAGNLQDKDFVTHAFAGADAVYLMIPPNFAVTDWLGYQQQVADNYVYAIKTNGIKKAVTLSSVGAHMKKGAGPVDGLAYMEDVLNNIPGLNTTHIRPSYFYYNLFNMAGMIKNAGIMGSNLPGNHELVLAHTSDIADAVANALLDNNQQGYNHLYVGSDKRSLNEITRILSEAAGKPGTPWVEFTDEQFYEGAVGAGLPAIFAKGYTEMGQALKSGEMESDFKQSPNTYWGKVKLEDFAHEFAAAYQKA